MMQTANRFIALDVETANADMASICQIGGVCFENGQEVSSFVYLIDPEGDFDDFNVAIHGITADAVANCPTLDDVADELFARLGDDVIVSHTHFDRVSLTQALDKYEMDLEPGDWLDSAKIARRAWNEEWFAAKGQDVSYRLRALADILGINFKHHDALEDARACGLIVLHAMEHTGFDLAGWEARCRRPITSDRVKLAAGEGPLADEILCFTGALQIARSEAAKLANSFGAAVQPGVTKKTTILVVGDQDISKLGGKEKSGKHLKAETMIAKGSAIRIVKESDFAQLCDRQYL